MWPAIIAGAAALGSAVLSSKSASKAASTQAAAADAATQAQLAIYNQNRQDQSMLRSASLTGLSRLLGNPLYGGASSPLLQSGPQAMGNLQGGAAPWTWQGGSSNPNLLASMYNGQPANSGTYDVLPTQGAAPPGSQQDGGYWNNAYQMPSLSQYQTPQTQQAQPGQGEITGYAGGGMLDKGPGEFNPEEEPGYKFGYQEFVEKPTLSLASARGRLTSGSTLKALSRYASDYASTKYDNFLDRYYKSLDPYFRVAGMGSNMQMQSGTGIANSMMASGTAQAAGQLGSAYPYAQLGNWGATNMLQYAGSQQPAQKPKWGWDTPGDAYTG